MLASVFSNNAHASYSYKSIRIASQSSDSTGIFIRISVPSIKRYSCGAPVVIYLNGGWGSSGMLGNMFNMSNYGFIVVEFNYPGGGSGTQKSGGIYDSRGINSMLAARDVIRFALGQTTDRYNKYLGYYTGTKSPLYNNVGIIGGSNGGCNLLSVLGMYPQDLNQVAWISFFESPIGDGMLTADPGKPYALGQPSAIHKNFAYNDSTGTYNWDLLSYAKDTVAYKVGVNSYKGLFYFDVNQNGIFNRGVDYDLIGRFDAVTLGAAKKYYYSIEVIQRAYEKAIYPLANPLSYQPDLEQTIAYWHLRSTENYIDSFMIHMPNIKVLFMVRDSDHITSAPNHPEVINAWNKFSANGCNWFRVNADKSYIQYVTGLTLPTAPDNDANVSLDNINIRNMIMPGNIFSDRYMNHYSSTLEMADRVMNNDWSLNLNGILSSTCPTTKIEDENEASNETLLYPNPAQNETYIQINATEIGSSTITIYNSIGQQVLQTQKEVVMKGFNLLILDVSNLSSGNYFVRVDAPGVNSTLQFTRE